MKLPELPEIKEALVPRGRQLLRRKTDEKHKNRLNKGVKKKMTDETNNKMELLARLSEKQPDAISSEQRMSLGIYEIAKQHAAANGLSADERLRLRGLKQSIATDNLSPSARTVMALEILNLEQKNTGEK